MEQLVRGFHGVRLAIGAKPHTRVLDRFQALRFEDSALWKMAKYVVIFLAICGLERAA